MRDKIMAMETGKLLDHLIAEDVMGWTRKGDCWFTTDGNVRTDETTSYKSFQPSTDISAAWEVFTKFEFPILEKGFDEDMNDYYVCKIGPHRVMENTAPLAICKCALLAVMDL